MHALFTLFSLLVYIAAGVFFDPGLMAKDLQKKYAWAATVAVSAWVPGPPGKPIPEASSSCGGSYPYIDLTWNPTTDTENYDIYRNGNPLITGTSSTHYQDNAVQAGLTYSYYLVAKGHYGYTQSDTIDQTAASCYTPPPPPPEPRCTITTLNNLDVNCLVKTAKTKENKLTTTVNTHKRRPVFSGTTNIADARIKATLVWKKTVVISSFNANENGYWAWKSPKRLKKRSYTLYVSATDPNDFSRTTESTINFSVRPAKKPKKSCEAPVSPAILSSPFYPKLLSALSLKILPQPDQDSQNPVASGQGVTKRITYSMENSSRENQAIVEYAVSDPQGNAILKEKMALSPGSGQPDLKTFYIPRFAPSGKYKLSAKTVLNGILLTDEEILFVEESPLINFGSNITYTFTDILSHLGWFVMVLAAILALLLFLLSLEYLFSRRARLQITEEELRHDSLIS